MAAKFFGQYLIDQGLISGFDLVRVLKFQEKKQPTLRNPRHANGFYVI